MQRLIDDLLVVSRAGRAELRREAVDMRELARLTLATLAPRIDETHAAVEVDPALPVVTGDSTQLGQLLQNLVTNALKFSHGEPHVEITAARENGHWRFSVTDDGIGVDPRHAERIFKLFRRLHGRDEYPGTGIGLSVCQRIVERHGGRIWVEPRPEGGSRFSFTLPAEREAVHRG
jgi:signal transduction histidine kinase